MSSVVLVDFVARMADAWDGRGDHVFRIGGAEHRALLELAGLPRELANKSWSELEPAQRYELVAVAAQRAIQLGRQCAWIFGEGKGARF